MKYVVDYKATDPVEIVSFKGYNSPTDIPEQAADVARVVLEGLADVASLGTLVLDAVAKFKGVAAEPEAVWESLVGGPKKEPPAKKIPDAEPKKKSSKKMKKGLQSVPDSSNPPDTGNTAEADKQEKKMAKAKKATKKNAKKTERKLADGRPRENSKAGKLLALIERKGGATFKEMQKVTGWKEMRGTASDLAKRVGKTLKMIKAEGKETRWAAV